MSLLTFCRTWIVAILFWRSKWLSRWAWTGVILCWVSCLQAVEPHILRSMVIVSGDQGRGSGFIVKMNDGIYVVTNSHVIRGNKNLVFKTLDNKALSIGPFEIADNVDLVRAPLPGASDALEILPNAQEHVKVRDAINVIGNSEGQEVVREIGGKILGIGPERVEVDAAFVAGNSGSPILLGNTDKIVGVATFMIIPRLPANTPSDSKDKKGDPTRLNQVRRFGYRLDTVGRWIRPPSWDRILREGQKLADTEELSTLLVAIVSTPPADLAKEGSATLLDEAKVAGRPVYAALAKALDTFSRSTYSRKNKNKNKAPTGSDIAILLEAVRAATAADLRGFEESQFTGYHATVFREQLDLRKELYSWLNSLLGERGNRPDEFDNPLARKGGAPVSSAKVSLQIKLEDKIDSSAPPANQHQIICQPGTLPTNLAGLFWIIENPANQNQAYQMASEALPLATPKAGSYRVWVENRAAAPPRVVSNVVEIKFSEAPLMAAPTTATTTPPKPAPIPAPIPTPAPAPKPAVTSIPTPPPPVVSSETLPAPWKHQDIGNVKVAGTAKFSGDTFVVQGALDLWTKLDGCHFAWLPLHGDGELIARVTALDNPSSNKIGKGGLCLRESLDAASRTVTLCATPGEGTTFLYRDSTRQDMILTHPDKANRVPRGQFPCWLKLTRHGDLISGYESLDGVIWRLTNQITMSLPTDTLIGLVATSIKKDVLLKATFDHVKLSALETKISEVPLTPAPTPKPTPAPPPPPPVVSSETLPPPWKHQDLRNNGRVAGTAAFSGDTFVVQGAEDLAGKMDGCQFAWQPLHGDGELVARVTAIENPTGGDSGKAGLCLRESLDADARTVEFYTTISSGTFFSSRDTPLHYTGWAHPPQKEGRVPKGQFPCWLKLTRHNDQISGYESSDGENWHLTAQTKVSLPADTVIGLVSAATKKDVLLKATFDHVKLSALELKSPETPAPTPKPTTLPASAIAPAPASPSPVVSHETLPAPWKHQDIGDVKAAGSAAFVGGSFVVQGAMDLWTTTDGCHFVWQPLHGDGELVARVTAIENPVSIDDAKGGLCLRDSLDADSRTVTLCATQAIGTLFLHRRRKHHGTRLAHPDPNGRVPKGQFPCWLKLVRHGDQISGYESTDGETWRLTEQINMGLPADTFIGLVAASHEPDKLLKATFDHVKLSVGSATAASKDSSQTQLEDKPTN